MSNSRAKGLKIVCCFDYVSVGCGQLRVKRLPIMTHATHSLGSHPTSDILRSSQLSRLFRIQHMFTQILLVMYKYAH